ncbi:MAG: hypothetical protein RLZZ200_2140 [Pseudomonadota bacterium]|jgi:cell division protein FtsN
MPAQRLTSRDFKSPLARRSAAAGRWRDMGLGLGAGLLVAGLVYVKEHRQPSEAPSPKAAAREAVAATGPKHKQDVAGDELPATNYDFYDRLPKFEVVPPEKGQAVRQDQPLARIDQPGSYVLQAGSFRSVDDAERARAKLAKLGINAAVQRVSVDEDVWHRIRIGPIDNLDQLNRVRDQLRRADVEPLVTRVGD